MASAELGGLGAREGTPLSYNLVLPGEAPMLVPWLGVLLALALKPNRRPQAWWILAPLGLVALIAGSMSGGLRAGPNQMLDVVAAGAFGLASLWLLSTHVRCNHRFLTFLLSLLVLVGGSELACLMKQGWSFEDSQQVVMPVVVLIFSAASALALSLAGLFCRRRYSRLRLSLWLIILSLATSLLGLAPFLVYALIAEGGPTWSECLIIVAVMAGIGFGTMLPFLVLSFATTFYGDRLKSLLHVAPGTVPPEMPLSMPVSRAAGQML